jgi:hypothetical protein
VVAQKSEVSKIVSILKSVRSEQLNEKISTCSTGSFLMVGKFGIELCASTVRIHEALFDSMSGSKARRRRIERNLNCRDVAIAIARLFLC